MCSFPRVTDASDVAIVTMMSGIQVLRVELLDEVQVKAVNLASGKNMPEAPTLMFEFIGIEAYTREQTLIVQKIASEYSGSYFVFAEDPEAKNELRKIPVNSTVIAHVGYGNLHTVILFDLADDDQRKEVERLNNFMVHATLLMEDSGAYKGVKLVSAQEITSDKLVMDPSIAITSSPIKPTSEDFLTSSKLEVSVASCFLTMVSLALYYDQATSVRVQQLVDIALSIHSNARWWYEQKKKQESKQETTVTTHTKAFKAAEKNTHSSSLRFGRVYSKGSTVKEVIKVMQLKGHKTNLRCTRKKQEDLVSVQDAIDIKLMKTTSMFDFEAKIWAKYGRANCEPSDTAMHFDRDSGKTYVYHCYVSIDGTYRFKGPFLNTRRTHLQRELGDDNGPFLNTRRTHLQRELGDDNVLIVQFTDDLDSDMPFDQQS
ncbi:D-lactate dehydrogenase [cytochrome], mitochondrial isoform X2 [Tanacetum coccineum]